MPQLYAEALAAYHAGEQWWLPPEIELIAEAEQDDRLTSDPWEEGVATVVDDMRGAAKFKGETFFWVTSVDGLKAIETKRELWDAGKQHRVALVLKKMGGKNMRLPRGAGWPKRGFRFITDPN
jgi:predicted P-loop ATPase